MTVYSQNGYPACSAAPLAWYTVPGTSERVRIRTGPVATVLLYVAQRWKNEIEPITQIGGYACRDIIGSNTTSNHASGTAVDIDWDKHPLGAQPSATFAAKVHAILNTVIGGVRVGDIIRWGGDYHSRKDGMHYEINAPLSQVTRLANAILNDHPAPVPPPTNTGEIEMEGIVKVGTKAAQFYYTFTGLVWIKDGDHLSRIEGEYKARTGKDIKLTVIGSQTPIQDGRYGFLNRADPGPTTAGAEAGWDFSAHRKTY